MAREITAVEFEAHTVRLLRGTPGGGAVGVTLYRAEPIPETGVDSSFLRDLFTRHGCAGEKVASSLPAGAVVARDLVFPFKEAGKVRDAVPFAIEPLLPYAMEEALFDSYPLAGSGPWPVRVLAVRRAAVAAHLRLLEEAGVVPTVVADPITCLINGLDGQGALPGDGPCGVVSVASGQAVVVVVEGGDERLRRILRWQPAAGDGVEAYAPLVEQVGAAWRGATAALSTPVTQIILTGELAAEEGLAATLGERLGVAVQVARLGLSESASADGRQWTTAPFVSYGLLLQVSRRAARAINFHRTHSPWMRELHNLRRHAVAYGVAVAAVLACAAGDLYATYTARNRVYTALSDGLLARFEQVMPPGTRVVNVGAQVGARLAKLQEEVDFFESTTRPDGQPLRWLNLLSTLLPEELDIEVISVALDTKDLRIQGTVKDFEAVERLKGIVTAAPDFEAVDVRDAKLSVDRQRVRFLLVLTPKGQDAASATFPAPATSPAPAAPETTL